MGLNHRFFCLAEAEGAYIQYQNYFEIESNAMIYDDLILYINDTLNWVSCLHFFANASILFDLPIRFRWEFEEWIMHYANASYKIGDRSYLLINKLVFRCIFKL